MSVQARTWNAATINTLAWLLEKDALRDGTNKPVGFAMHRWGTTVAHVTKYDRIPAAKFKGCGTVCCIGGSAQLLATGRVDDSQDGEEEAIAWLGIDFDASRALFYPDDMRSRTKAKAVRVLRHLAKTGIVDWDIR